VQNFYIDDPAELNLIHGTGGNGDYGELLCDIYMKYKHPFWQTTERFDVNLYGKRNFVDFSVFDNDADEPVEFNWELMHFR